MRTIVFVIKWRLHLLDVKILKNLVVSSSSYKENLNDSQKCFSKKLRET